MKRYVYKWWCTGDTNEWSAEGLGENVVTVPMTTEMSKSPLNNDETIQSYETAWYRRSVNRLFAQSMQIVQVLQHTFFFYSSAPFTVRYPELKVFFVRFLATSVCRNTRVAVLSNARDLIDPNQRAQCNRVVWTNNYAFGCIRRIYGQYLSNSERFHLAWIWDFNHIDDFIGGELWVCLLTFLNLRPTWI